MAATTTAGLAVYATNGSAGVAYAGYQAPADWSTKRFWVGRAGLTAAANGWQQIDATDLTYTWTQYDLGTLKPVAQADGAATVPAFLAAHGGDGPGFYATGFGCDGQPFKIDRCAPAAPARHDVRPRGLHQHRRHQRLRLHDHRGESVTLSGVVRDQWARTLPRLARPGGRRPARTGSFRSRARPPAWTPATRA